MFFVEVGLSLYSRGELREHNDKCGNNMNGLFMLLFLVLFHR